MLLTSGKTLGHHARSPSSTAASRSLRLSNLQPQPNPVQNNSLVIMSSAKPHEAKPESSAASGASKIFRSTDNCKTFWGKRREREAGMVRSAGINERGNGS